jgi:hypothetical protein
MNLEVVVNVLNVKTACVKNLELENTQIKRKMNYG